MKITNQMRIIEMKFVFFLVFAGAILGFGAVSCTAQPFTLDDQIKPSELKLVNYAGKSAKEKGKIAVAEVNQKDPTLYFYIKGISIFSPVMVIVESQNLKDSLAISFHKDLWTEIESSGKTDEDGVYSATFKTGSEFGLMVNSGKLPAKYKITVWVGDEILVDMQSPFKKGKTQ